MAKKNDFNQDAYVDKVDSATEKLEKVEGRLAKIEELTDVSLLLKIFKKDTDLRDELTKLIWKTIKDKALQAFLYILLAVILIPILSKLFSIFMLKFFNVKF